MYFRSRLLHHMRRAKVLQKDVADRWLARVDRLDPRPTLLTVRSHLNRLIRHEEPASARFFFRTRGLGVALFDSIEIPEWERDELFAAAEALIESHRRRA